MITWTHPDHPEKDSVAGTSACDRTAELSHCALACRSREGTETELRV